MANSYSGDTITTNVNNTTAQPLIPNSGIANKNNPTPFIDPDEHVNINRKISVELVYNDSRDEDYDSTKPYVPRPDNDDEEDEDDEIPFFYENEFPEDLFTEETRNRIKSFCVSNNIKYEVETMHYGNAFCTALCHRYYVALHETWKILPNLWVIGVGKSGTNKTGLMQTVYKPIIDKDLELALKFKNDKDIYDKQQKLEKTKERKKKNPDSVNLSTEEIKNIEQNLDNQSGQNFAEPTELSIKNEDFTFAQILNQLDYKHNDGRQQIIIYDELLGLFKSFNSYGGTHDEENYNKLYDYGSMTVKRKNGDLNSIIKEKCVCLAGTTQKQTLFQMFTPERIYNGNVYRHLFVIDDDAKFINPLKNINDKNNLEYKKYLDDYSKIMSNLLADYGYNINRKELKYTPEAFEYYKNYIDECSEKYGDNENSLSVFGKMINTITKFAIMFNRDKNINYTTFKINDDVLILDLKDIKDACKLNEYCVKNTFLILEYTGNKANKIAKNNTELKFLDQLPMTFTTQNFIDKYVIDMNVSIPTAKRRLKDLLNGGGIKRNRRGEYYKTN